MNSTQVVLITGSSTGFGRLFTETLARKGHTVFATMRDPGGRNAKNAGELRALAQKESLPIHVLELDVTDDASVGRAVDAAVAKTGRIDVAINNAGYYLGGLAEAVTAEQAQRLMDTNFLGPVAAAQQEFDEHLADVLDGMADRMSGKTSDRRNGFRSSVAGLEKTIRTYDSGNSQRALPAQLGGFLSLSRKIASLTISLDNEMSVHGSLME